MSRKDVSAAFHRGNRPLSPHLQIYRPQITMVMSAFHRITGVGLTLGAVMVVWWFVAAATGPEYFKWVDDWIVTSWLGHLALFGLLLSLMYHLCNGVRHLLWDAGYGFGLDEVRESGFIALGGAGVLSVFLLVIGLFS